MRRLLVLLVLLTCRVYGQRPPYDVFPAAESPYYRVRYEPSEQPGELAFGANFTLWVPPGVKVLRGVVVHQHGCGEGSCKSGLTGAYDLHWQALARRHDCALLAPAYEQPEAANCQLWCDPRQGSDVAFQRALKDLGIQSGHSELASVPWALWGHSGGGLWAGGMTLLHPDRVVAAWLRSGVPQVRPVEGRQAPFSIPEAARHVPMMCNLGTREGFTDTTNRFAGVWPGSKLFFETLREQGALIGVAIDPLTSHECGNQRYLAIPWLDHCLAARLPRKPGAPLNAMPSREAWLADLTDPGKATTPPVPFKEYSGVKARCVWLPDKAIAAAWYQYIQDTAVPDKSPPPAPRHVEVRGAELTWDAEADPDSGLAQFLIERDGVVVATVAGQGRNPYGRPVFQGLQYSDTPPQPLPVFKYTDPAPTPGVRHRYRVVSVNTAGLKSK